MSFLLRERELLVVVVGGRSFPAFDVLQNFNQERGYYSTPLPQL